MWETTGTMFMHGVAFGAFLAGAAFGLTGVFLLLCRVTDAYEDWRKEHLRKRYERERHERRLASRAKQAERNPTAGRAIE